VVLGFGLGSRVLGKGSTPFHPRAIPVRRRAPRGEPNTLFYREGEDPSRYIGGSDQHDRGFFIFLDQKDILALTITPTREREISAAQLINDNPFNATYKQSTYFMSRFSEQLLTQLKINSLLYKLLIIQLTSNWRAHMHVCLRIGFKF
jgi:hypothetical protein